MNDKKIKHLDLIQQNITRMASNSFIIKGWSVTSIGAMYAFWITKLKESYSLHLLLLILVVTLIFWGHDAYYLMLERGFRNLYDEVRASPEDCDFKLTPNINESVICVALERPILRNSYGLITLFTLGLLFFLK